DQNTTTYLDTLTANSTSFQEKFMYEGRELQYTIESVGSRGSKYQTVKVTTPLFKPEQVWFDSSAIPTAAININWQNNSELPHLIVIERSTNKQTFEEIGRVYSPETSYSDKS